MADPRLRWTQVNAPSFAGAAALLSQANNSFTNGIGAAQDILSKYNTGQQEKEDAALIADLAGLKYEDDFGAFVDGGGLNNRNISDALRGEVLSMRSNLLANDSTRAGTEATRASTSRANAAESRTQFDFEDRVARQRAERSAASNILAAQGGATLNNHDFDGVNGGGALQNYLNNTIQSESSGNPNAKNPNSTATGLAQFTEGTWAEMMRKHPELGLTADGRTDPNQSIRALEQFTRNNMASLQRAGIPVTEGTLYAAHFLGAGGANRVFSQSGIDGDLIKNHVDPDSYAANKNVLEGMTVGEFKQWASRKGGGGNVPTQASVQRDLANSGLFTASEILAQTQGIADANKATDDTIVAETHDSLVLDALQNNTTTDAAIQDGLANTTELPASERLKIAQQIQATGTTDAGQSILAPNGGPLQPEIEASVALANAAVDTANSSTPQGQLLTDANRYRDSGDPIASLASDLELDTNAQNDAPWFGQDSVFDRNKLNNIIREIASESNVDLATAAAAARAGFVRDPWFKNTLRKRFPKEEIKERIKTDLDQAKVQNYRESRASQEVFRQRQAAVLSRMQQIQSKMNKSGADRNALSNELAALTLELGQLQAQNKPSDRVNSAEPQSPRDIFEEVVGAAAP